ncbi:MAG: flavodoxin domain-containing protein [Acidimicrobiales bacterium]
MSTDTPDTEPDVDLTRSADPTPLRVLLAYHSGEGHTAKVAERVAGVFRAGGAVVTVALAEDAPPPEAFDAVIAGDSVHAGRHSKALTRWLARYADELNDMPLAMFQVSLASAAQDQAHTTEAHRLLHRLLDATAVDPDLVGLFAGALTYTRYGWLKRRVMHAIAAKQGEDTDTDTDYDYTDWEAIEHFAADALRLAHERQHLVDGASPMS